VGLAASLALAHPASAGTVDERVAQRVATLRAGGWTVEHGTDGVQVLSRGTPGSPVREVVAVAIAPAAPARLMAVVTDYAAYPAFIPYVVACEVLPSPDGVTRVFQHLDFGPPIKDRAYTIRMIPFQSPHDGTLGLAWTLETAPEYQRDTPAVRPPVNDGGWRFTPLEDGTSTLVEYLVRSDPGGWIPRWAANMAMRHSVPKVVNVVSERAAAGP